MIRICIDIDDEGKIFVGTEDMEMEAKEESSAMSNQNAAGGANNPEAALMAGGGENAGGKGEEEGEYNMSEVGSLAEALRKAKQLAEEFMSGQGEDQFAEGYGKPQQVMM